KIEQSRFDPKKDSTIRLNTLDNADTFRNFTLETEATGFYLVFTQLRITSSGLIGENCHDVSNRSACGCFATHINFAVFQRLQGINEKVPRMAPMIACLATTELGFSRSGYFLVFVVFRFDFDQGVPETFPIT